MKRTPAEKPGVDWSKVEAFHLEYEEYMPSDEATARKEVIEEYANSLRELAKAMRKPVS